MSSSKFTYSNRELRVFLSSTFTDMKFERNHLINNVFPEIRKKCLERGVGFTEVDLRWGITEQSTKNGETIEICLKEIDRCREHPPFFIGFIGERYGWIPEEEELMPYFSKTKQINSDNENIIRERIETAINDKISVTHLEFLYGIYHPSNNQAPAKARFYFRDVNLTKELCKLSDGRKELFYSEGKKVDDLKNYLRASNSDIIIDGYKNIESFGDSIKNLLLTELNNRYPIKAISSSERYREYSFFYSKLLQDLYIPRLDIETKIKEYCLKKLNGLEKRPFIILGESGIGKSSLLSSLEKTLGKHLHEEFGGGVVLSTHLGVGEPANLSVWRDSLMGVSEGEGQKNLDTKEIILSEEIMNEHKMWQRFYDFLEEKSRNNQNYPIVILLDGLCKISSYQQAIETLHLNCLPKNVVLICSSSKGGFNEKQWHRLSIPPLSISEKMEFMKAFLNQKGKELEFEDFNKILNSDKTSTPIYLKTLLEELCMYGASHRNLTQHIDKLLKNNSSSEILTEVITEFDKLHFDYSTNLATEFIHLIQLSRRGLTEHQIKKLLFKRMNDRGDSTFEYQGVVDKDLKSENKIPARTFSQLFFRLSPFLITINGFVLINNAYKFDISEPEIVKIRQALLSYFRQDNCDAHVTEVLFNLKQILTLKGISSKESRVYINELIQLLGNPETLSACFNIDSKLLKDLLIMLGAESSNISPILEKIIKLWSGATGNSLFNESISDFFYLNNFNNLNLVWHKRFIRKLKSQASNKLTEAIVRLGLIHMKNNELNVALDFFHEALTSYEVEKREEGTQLKAQVLSNMALIYKRQSKLDQAITTYSNAIKYDDKNIVIWSNLAMCYIEAGEIDIGKSILTYLVNRNENSLPYEYQSYFVLLQNLACAYFDLNDFNTAIELLHQSNDRLNESFINGDFYKATALNNLGKVYLSMNKFEEAESLLKESYYIRNKILVDSHPHTITSLNNLATLYQRTGRMDEGINIFEYVLQTSLDVFGNNHPESAVAMNNLAMCYSDMSRHEEALRLLDCSKNIYLKSTVSIQEKVQLVNDNIEKVIESYVFPLILAASKLINDKDLDNAKKILLNVEEITINRIPENHRVFSALYLNFGLIYRIENQIEDAVKNLYQSMIIDLSLSEKKLKFYSPAYEALTSILIQCDATNSLESIYIDKLNLLQKILESEEGVSDILKQIDIIYDFYVKENKPGQLAVILQKNLNVLKNILSSDSVILLTPINQLAHVYFKIDAYEHAESLFRDAFSIYSNNLPPEHEYIATASTYLGNTIARQGRFDEAEIFFKKALNINESVLQETDQDFVDSLRNLSTIYIDMQKYDEARELLIKEFKIRSQFFPDESSSLSRIQKQLDYINEAIS